MGFVIVVYALILLFLLLFFRLNFGVFIDSIVPVGGLINFFTIGLLLNGELIVKVSTLLDFCLLCLLGEEGLLISSFSFSYFFTSL